MMAHPLLRFAAAAAGAAWLPTGNLQAQPAAAPVDFSREVHPLLQRYCVECHGPEKKKGGLRLDSNRAALKGGSTGPALVAGKPADSELYRRVLLPKGDAAVMPARGEPLTDAQKDVLRRWIEQGAAWPDQVTASKHWAYVKPVRPAVPAAGAGATNPIDHFIRARLEKEGLKPSPEADRAVLVRRVYLDLTGLPPTPEEADAFLKDAGSDAYGRLVDRLLASPQFGERWARMWLDLARYADSHGFQRDDLREIWPYRDWVIRALNDNMPFDRFTIEQIAGDLLPGAGEAQRVATGFNRCTPINVEAGSDPEETRVNQVFDRVNTVGAVWLGSTLECCQCHDHKYDPFKQSEYYRLFAYFNGTEMEADRSNPKVPGSIRFIGPSMPLAGAGDSAAQARLEAKLKDLNGRLDARRQALAADLDRWAADLSESAGKASHKHVLEIADFESSAGSPFKTLEDKSVLLVDDPPDKDTYTVTVRTALRGITGFELECLTDPSLPGNGPGRGDAKRPNFVLNSFSLTAGPDKDGAAPSAVRLRADTASFSQKGYDVSGAVDDDPKTAWAINPEFHKPHWARFAAEAPVGFEGGTVLKFTLIQNFGSGRTIGRLRLSAIIGDPKARPVPAEAAAALAVPREKRTAAQTDKLLDLRMQEDEACRRIRGEIDGAQRDANAAKPPTTLIMRELPEPRPTTVFTRGDFRTPGAKVAPGVPAVLHGAPEGPGNRLTLARWLTDRDNPLTARVQVNRIWTEIFGRGIVSTVEDFGIKGEPPTHPELLDWLAVDFMENGWSIKKLLRTIVTSATYRQSSRLTPELAAKDDANRLLARGPRFRMDAEMIRDSLLASAGLLSRKQFGPPVRPYQPEGLWNKVGGARVEYIVSPGEDRYRRGVYVVWKRASPYPSFVNFDAGARLACTVKRSRSNTPLQALTLLNDPVYVEAALALAKRVIADLPDATAEQRLRRAFRLCVTREPREDELRILLALLEEQTASARKDPKAVAALLGKFELPNGIARAEFAAWYAVASAVLNLDETITKG